MARNGFDDNRIAEGTLARGSQGIGHTGFHESLAISRDDVRDGVAELPSFPIGFEEQSPTVPPTARVTAVPDSLSVRAAQSASAARVRVCFSGMLIGDRARNAAGEDLGTIKEVAIDLISGSVAGVVLSFGGFVGIGDKIFLVPWHALRVDDGENEFVIDVARQVLQDSPGVDRHNWPVISERWCGLATGTEQSKEADSGSIDSTEPGDARETNRSIRD
jgi:hypothetical protein